MKNKVSEETIKKKSTGIFFLNIKDFMFIVYNIVKSKFLIIYKRKKKSKGKTTSGKIGC